MADVDSKAILHQYLPGGTRGAALETGPALRVRHPPPADSNRANLLGLVKHLSIVEAWYFGKTFGRPFPEHLPWWDDDAATNADSWATEHETRDEIVDRYRRVAARADATIDALALDGSGPVPWWPKREVTLHTMLVHVLAETNRHTGHADILREQLDGAAGMNPDFANLPEQGTKWWEDYRARIERAARKTRLTEG